jgi:hypothetical protein
MIRREAAQLEFGAGGALAGSVAGNGFSREWSRRRMDAVSVFQRWLSKIKFSGSRPAAQEFWESGIGTNGLHAKTPRRKENCGNSQTVAGDLAAWRLGVGFYAAPMELEFSFRGGFYNYAAPLVLEWVLNAVRTRKYHTNSSLGLRGWGAGFRGDDLGFCGRRHDFAGSIGDFAGGGRDFAGAVLDRREAHGFRGRSLGFHGNARHFAGSIGDFAGGQQDFSGAGRGIAGTGQDFAGNFWLSPGSYRVNTPWRTASRQPKVSSAIKAKK